MKKWMRREIDELRVAQAETSAQRRVQRELLLEVADVVVGLRVASEKLERALTEYIEKYGEPVAEDTEAE